MIWLKRYLMFQAAMFVVGFVYGFVREWLSEDDEDHVEAVPAFTFSVNPEVSGPENFEDDVMMILALHEWVSNNVIGFDDGQR